MPTSSWTVVEPTLPALTYTYSFGPGIANALALVVEGGVVVVSPPYQPTDALFADLEKHGPVRAIVTPNAFLVMCHGAPVRPGDPAAEVRAALA